MCSGAMSGRNSKTIRPDVVSSTATWSLSGVAEAPGTGVAFVPAFVDDGGALPLPSPRSDGRQKKTTTPAAITRSASAPMSNRPLDEGGGSASLNTIKGETIESLSPHNFPSQFARKGDRTGSSVQSN